MTKPLQQEDVKNALLNVMADLREVNVRNEAVLASIADGVIVVNRSNIIILINHSVEKLLGWKIHELVGKKWYQILRLEDGEGNLIPPEKGVLRNALVDGTTTYPSAISTYYYVRKDGTKFPVAITVSPVILERKIIGAVNVFRDITKEKEIDKAKSEFISIASHQLRTPLGITKWYLEAIREEDYFKNAPQKSFAYLNEIYKNNERLISLVRNLLSVSRIDQGRIKDEPQNTDVTQLIKDIVKEMSLAATTKKIRLDLMIKSGSLPTVFIDPLRLREVIENLITNAIEYNVSSGRVEVIFDKKTDSMLLISIKDTGFGLSEKDKEKLFTKFFRSEKAVSKNPNGSGLGLYVVKSYVEDWGGKIFVESTEEKGSAFTITIPLNIKENRKEVAKN